MPPRRPAEKQREPQSGEGQQPPRQRLRGRAPARPRRRPRASATGSASVRRRGSCRETSSSRMTAAPNESHLCCGSHRLWLTVPLASTQRHDEPRQQEQRRHDDRRQADEPLRPLDRADRPPRARAAETKRDVPENDVGQRRDGQRAPTPAPVRARCRGRAPTQPRLSSSTWTATNCVNTPEPRQAVAP